MPNEHTTELHGNSRRDPCAGTDELHTLCGELKALAATWCEPRGSEICGPAKRACAAAMLAVLRRRAASGVTR